MTNIDRVKILCINRKKDWRFMKIKYLYILPILLISCASLFDSERIHRMRMEKLLSKQSYDDTLLVLSKFSDLRGKDDVLGEYVLIFDVLEKSGKQFEVELSQVGDYELIPDIIPGDYRLSKIKYRFREDGLFNTVIVEQGVCDISVKAGYISFAPVVFYQRAMYDSQSQDFYIELYLEESLGGNKQQRLYERWLADYFDIVSSWHVNSFVGE
jgi:hypothetical protein